MKSDQSFIWCIVAALALFDCERANSTDRAASVSAKAASTATSSRPNPSGQAATASAAAANAGAVSSASKSGPREYPPGPPCDAVARDPQEYIGCWFEYVYGVRDDLDKLVVAQRAKGGAVSATVAQMLKEESAWEARRDARCNAKDNGQMGQGMSVGTYAVMQCRYDADRERLTKLRNATRG